MPKTELISTPDGEMTRREAAVRYGIPKNTLIRRIWAGWPPERWFEPPDARLRSDRGIQKRNERPAHMMAKYCSPWGWLSIYNLAERIGMSHGSLCHRLYGRYDDAKMAPWSFEHATNTRPYGVRNRDLIMPWDEYHARVKEHGGCSSPTLSTYISTSKRLAAPI